MRPGGNVSDLRHLVLILLTLFLGGLTLRPQLVGIGPLLAEIQADLRLSHATAGLLASIPVLCMGLLAPLGPLIGARAGTTFAVGGCIALIGIAGLVRSAAGEAWTLLSITVAIGIGIGAAGALLPVVVREHLPKRALDGNIAYSTGIQAGAAAAAASAVPLAGFLGGWRGALIAFSLLTLVVVLPWALGFRRTARPAEFLKPIAARDYLDPTGWWLACLFGLFGVAYYGLVAWLADAYVEFGWTAADAGRLLGVLSIGALAGTVIVRFISALVGGQDRAIALFASLFAASLAGLALLPMLGIVWASLAGFANGALFPLMLTLPHRSATSVERVAVRSTVMVGGGYTLAAVSPVALGAARDVSGDFAAVMIALGGVSIALLLGLLGTLRRSRTWAS